jgi:hypothetical protein
METTYSHLTDDDHIEAAEVAAGRREPATDTPAARQTCPNPDCLNELDPADKACSSCGTVVSPDAKAVEQQAEDRIPEIRDETEAKLVSKILNSVREDPDAYLDDE